MYCQCHIIITSVILISSSPRISALTSDKPTDPTTTTLKPTTPTTITTTTTPPTTTTTTTPTTTTTTPPTTTTKAPARLGGNCTGEDAAWCGTHISGAICDGNNQCQCNASHFRMDETTCLNRTILIPTSIAFPSIDETSLGAQWLMADTSLTWEYNISCNGINSSYEDVHTGLTTTQATCGGLVSGDRYTVTVIAYFTNDVGEVYSGDKTEEQAIYPAQPGRLDKGRSNFTAPDVTLYWDASSGIVGHYSLQGDVNKPSVRSPEAIVGGLVPGHTYSFTITAVSNGMNSIPRSDSFTTDSQPPGSPEHLTVSGTSTDRVILSWDKTDKPNGAITSYIICYQGKVYDDLDWSPDICENKVDSGSSVTHTVGQLKSGAFYDFRVYSVNVDYNGTEFASISLRTNQSAPEAVVNLTVVPSNLTFTVTWQRPETPNGDIIQYKIEWRSDALTCSDFLPTPGQNAASSSTQGCSSHTGESINVNQKAMAYSITDLKAYTNYTVTVTPYTSQGTGASDSTSSSTSIIAPGPVRNVTASVLNSTAVKVSWLKPVEEPGPVTYIVKYHDMIEPATHLGCTLEGFNETHCIVDQLEEFWVYQFVVMVTNTAGTSTARRTENITTDEGVPGAVSAVSVDLYNSPPAACDATRVMIHWTEPDLRNRNALIKEYKIHDFITESVENPVPYSKESRSFSREVTGLTAETSFTWEIQAIPTSENVLPGVKKEFSFTTESCKPPAWGSLRTIDDAGDSTPTSFKFRLTGAFFFSNDEQGQIREAGFIISKTNDEGLEVIDVRGRSWSWAQQNDFSLPYTITPYIPTSSDKFEVTVGENETCAANVQTSTKCNGQLPSSQDFYVKAYACTSSTKCSASPFYGPFSTAAMPTEAPPSDAAPIIAGVCVGVGIVLIVAMIAVLQLRGVIDIMKPFRKGEGPGPRPGPPPQKVICKRPMPSEKGPVKFSEFDNYIRELHKDTNLLFSCQYEDIDKLSKTVIYPRYTTEAANFEDNKPKNRWVNILPFDHSRVKQQQLDDDDPTSDYINANYIPGFKHQRDYIATQGPLPGTIDDFWRMIWEHNIAVIVMLTQCKEGNRVKCEPYWPTEVHEPKQYGEVVVDPVSVSTLNKYNITIFNVSMNDVKRTVYHFHYLEFPDMSANVEYDIFLEFLQVVRGHVPRNNESPIVVHCSAGVGRTGTYIILDRMMQTLNSPDFNWEMKVDLFDMVIQLRNNRTNMIQTESQYVMIHDCLSKMLEEKKRVTEPDDSLYVNQAYDAYPEDIVLYENLKGNEMKTDL